MATISLAVNSTTLVINGRTINDTMAGDRFVLAPVNPATARINGAGGVSIQARTDKDVHDLTINIMKESADDSWLNGLLKESPPAIITGSLKNSFTRDGTDGIESYSMESGSFTTKPTGTYSDTDGNALMTYVIQVIAVRSL